MRKKLLAAGLGLALSLPAVAVNWNFLKYSPASHFVETDWDLMRQTGREALDNAPDGATRGWNNSETGAFGTIQPLNTYEAGGSSCRRTEIFNSANGTSGTSRFDFCKQADGSWKVAPRRTGAASPGNE